MMRFFIFAVTILLVSSIDVYGQRGGGSGGMGGGMGGGGGKGGPKGKDGQQSEATAALSQGPIDIILACGFIVIDQDEIIDKCKIDEPAQLNSTKQIIAEYKAVYDAVALEHKEELAKIKMLQDALKSSDRNPSIIKAELAKYSATTKAIQAKMTPAHMKLLGDMDLILKDKSLARWEKFYLNMCNENFYNPMM